MKADNARRVPPGSDVANDASDIDAASPSGSGRRATTRPVAHTRLDRTVPAVLEALRRAKDPSATPPVSRRQRWVQTLTRRPVTITSGVPGTGRVFNRPVRAGVPNQVHAGTVGPAGPLGQAIERTPSVAESPAKAAIRDAEDIARIAASLERSLAATEATVFAPPARSRMARLARRLPGLHPTGLRDTAAPASAGESAGAENASSQPDDAGSLRDPLQIMRQREENAALAALFTQRIADARTILSNVQGKPDHTPAMRRAADALDKALRGTALLHVENMRTLADAGDARLDFAMRRLSEIKTEVYGIKDKAASDRAAAEARLHALAEESAALQTHDHQLSAADDIVDIATTRFNRLSGQLSAATRTGKRPANAFGTPGASYAASEHEALQQAVSEARGLLDSALEVQTRNVQRMQRFSEIQQEILALMSERADADRLWHAADRAVKPLLDASVALPTHPDNEAAARAKEAEAIDAAKAAVLEQLTDAVHVFPAGGGPALQAQLKALASTLLQPSPPIPIPAAGAVRLITQAAADIGLDGNQTAAALAEMARRPVGHWVSADPGGDALSTQVAQLSRKLASLPRGTTLLHVISRDGATAPDADRLQALRVYWAADEALANLSDDDGPDRAWLEQARHVASSKSLENTAEQSVAGKTPAIHDDVALGAYNAVRNGYLSIAPGSPYDLHDRRLRKAIDEWVIRAGGIVAPAPASSGDTRATATDGPAAPTRLRRAMPHLVKSPFRSGVLGRAFAVGESMGLQSLRIQVDTALDQKLGELERRVAASDGDAGPDRDAAAALLAHLRAQQAQGKHLSEYTLGTADVKALQLRLAGPSGARRALPPGRSNAAANGANGAAPDATTTDGRNRLRKRPPVVLPESIGQLCADRLSAYEALNRLASQLSRTAENEETDAAAQAAEADLSAALQLVKSRRFAKKEHVLTYFNPLIENSRLRDRLRMGGGGALGLNLPSLPYAAFSPVASPIFTAERARSDEAFVQLFMPILGFEMTFGSTKTRATEATVGVAAGPTVAPGVAIQGAFTLRGARQRTRMDGTVVRFFRRRHQDAEMRANMGNALDSIVRWDSLDPARGARYAGPMEALLSRNPLVSVASVEGRTSTDTVVARLSARLPSAHFNDAHGAAQTLGLELFAGAEIERIKESRTEQGGKVRIDGAHGDTAQQRLNAGATLSASPLSNQSVPVGDAGKQGAVQREALPLQWSITRELAWFKAQHEISPFIIEDQQDADIDRHTATPDDILGEIKENRDAWLMRCIETLEPDAEGNKDNPANRKAAALHLDAFEKTVAGLGRDSRYCHYNVNYSMRGATGVQIDVYRGLKRLAVQRGDAVAAQEAQNAIDDMLRMRSTWRPLMLIVRERARDSTSTGWRSLLRWQHIGNIDAQRTAAQFPPP